MPTTPLPARNILDGSANPTTSQMKIALGQLHDNLSDQQAALVVDASGDVSINGKVAVQSGTAAAPSIAPTGDTNTGVYFPAADQVAISTGGTQRVVVDANGNLLVGTVFGNQGKAVINGRLQAGALGVSNNEFALALAPRSAAASVWNLTAANNVLEIKTGGNIDQTGNLEICSITGSSVRPGSDNAYSLGEPSRRWSVVYAATGTINTSDERAKLDFGDTLGLDFILKLEPVSYRYRNGKTVIDQVEDGVEEVPAVLDEQGNEVTPATTKPKYKNVERIEEGRRRHHGLKAQQVKQTLDQFGSDFAGWILTDPENTDSEQGLRYDQFIAPLIKAIQEQQALIESLTTRIAALEAK
jgi:hypothetical protein